MYSVRSKVHGYLMLPKVGKAFGEYGQKGVLTNAELEDPEVKRAILEGQLEILGAVPNTTPEISSKTSMGTFSDKDWERFRAIMLDCADQLSDSISEVIREEGEALRESLKVSPGASNMSQPRRAKDMPFSEGVTAEYVLTPNWGVGSSKVETSKTQEGDDDLMSGLAALKKLRKGG